MTEALFEIKITASGEVRDAEGRLLETIPVESTRVVTQSELDALLKEMEEK